MSTQVLMAFTEEQTARLAKVSVSQLTYWDRTGFFRPSKADENRKLKYSRNYSFIDIVGLRTLSMLINEYSVPTRYLRKVRDCLSRPQELWADTTLFILGKRVYLQEPEAGSFIEPTSGQLTLKNIPLRRVLNEVVSDVEKLKRRDFSQIGKVSTNRFVSRNSAVVDGTRVPLSTIKAYLDEGFSREKIVSEFPSLTVDDVIAVERHLGLGAA